MLSAVVLTKNEENKIASLIKNLAFASEVIVIDDYSQDSTVKIAKNNGAVVYSRYLKNNFAAQRNYALTKAKYDWILFVDADEYVSETLALEILESIKNKAYNGFYINRKGYWMGKKMRWGEWANSRLLTKYGHNKLLRLAKKNSGKWKRTVHEYWDVKGRVGNLTHTLMHKNDNDLKQIIKTLNFQARLHSAANGKEGKKVNLFKIIFYPLSKFGVNYFFKGGFCDGIYGFVHAILMSFHSFLAWSQLYLDQKQK